MNDQPNAHCRTWDLIPWVVNGTATPAQRERVEQHLRDCPDCRREFALQQQLLAGMRDEPETAHDPQPALRRLLARLDTELPAATTAVPERPRGMPTRWTPWLAAAVVVQAIGLSLLGGMLLGRPDAGVLPIGEPGYRTLSSESTPNSATIRLVVTPDTTLARLRALLGQTRLRIVESTVDNAALGLAPQDAAMAADPEFVRNAIARLRSEPGVVLAEPVAGAAGPAR